MDMIRDGKVDILAERHDNMLRDGKVDILAERHDGHDT